MRRGNTGTGERILDRINAAFEALEADVDLDESAPNFDNATGDEEPDALAPEPAVDTNPAQILQASGALGSAFDTAKFSVQGGADALVRIDGMMHDAAVLVEELRALSSLPPEQQKAFEQYEDGYALTRVQDMVEQLEQFEQHMTNARKMLTQVVKEAERYRAEIKTARGA